jgi:hypothetical protein
VRISPLKGEHDNNDGEDDVNDEDDDEERRRAVPECVTLSP